MPMKRAASAQPIDNGGGQLALIHSDTVPLLLEPNYKAQSAVHKPPEISFSKANRFSKQKPTGADALYLVEEKKARKGGSIGKDGRFRAGAEVATVNAQLSYCPETFEPSRSGTLDRNRSTPFGKARRFNAQHSDDVHPGPAYVIPSRLSRKGVAVGKALRFDGKNGTEKMEHRLYMPNTFAPNTNGRRETNRALPWGQAKRFQVERSQSAGPGPKYGAKGTLNEKIGTRIGSAKRFMSSGLEGNLKGPTYNPDSFNPGAKGKLETNRATPFSRAKRFGPSQTTTDVPGPQYQHASALRLRSAVVGKDRRFKANKEVATVNAELTYCPETFEESTSGTQDRNRSHSFGQAKRFNKDGTRGGASLQNPQCNGAISLKTGVSMGKGKRFMDKEGEGGQGPLFVPPSLGKSFYGKMETNNSNKFGGAKRLSGDDKDEGPGPKYAAWTPKSKTPGGGFGKATRFNAKDRKPLYNA